MKNLSSFILLLLTLLSFDAYGQRYIFRSNTVIPTETQRARMVYGRMQQGIGGWVAPVLNTGPIQRTPSIGLPSNVIQRSVPTITVRPSVTRAKEVLEGVSRNWGPSYRAQMVRHLGDLGQVILSEREEMIIKQANPTGSPRPFTTPPQLVNTTQVRNMRNSVGGNCGGNCPNIQQRLVTIGTNARNRIDGAAVWCASGNCGNDNPQYSFYIKTVNGLEMNHVTLLTAYTNSGYFTGWGIGVPKEEQQFDRLRVGTTLLQKSGISSSGVTAGRKLLSAAETLYGAQEIIIGRY